MTDDKEPLKNAMAIIRLACDSLDKRADYEGRLADHAVKKENYLEAGARLVSASAWKEAFGIIDNAIRLIETSPTSGKEPKKGPHREDS